MIVTSKVIVGPWVAQRTKTVWTPRDKEAVGWATDHKLVAGVIYDNYNGKSVTCGIAVEGILTPTYLWAIFDYPFNQLRVWKIIASVASSNSRSRRLVEHMGFVKECQLLDAHPDGDLLLYTMTRDQCRFIGERYVQRRRLTSSRA